MYLTWSLLNAAAFKGIPYASGCSCPRALRNQPSMLRGRHQNSWERPKGFRSWRHSSKAALVHRMSSEGNRSHGLPAPAAAVAARGPCRRLAQQSEARGTSSMARAPSSVPDELETAAATPVSVARTLSEQRVDAKAMAVLRDAEGAGICIDTFLRAEVPMCLPASPEPALKEPRQARIRRL